MYLKQLTVAGFKSFAKPTTLGFTTPITAVVGPNGSGKSNIAEAVRFVLGEQSMKSLRGKRGEDLIFNGTEGLARLNRASVAITFRNKNRIFNIDFDEVEIKRVVNRDGINQYFLNGNQTRLKDIVEILASVHVGASNHHIISQGEADRILNASPKERREMIEDALGLKIYQYKRLESERKLTKTKENILQVRAIEKEVLPHLYFLEKQVLKITQAEKLKDELKELYRIYLKVGSTLFTEKRKKVDAERSLPERVSKEIGEEILKSEVLLKQEQGATASNEDLCRLEGELIEMRGDKDRVFQELGKVEGALEYTALKMNKLSLEKEKEERKISFSYITIHTFRDALVNLVKESLQEEESTRLKQFLSRIKELVELFFAGQVEDVGGGEYEEAKEKHDSLFKEKGVKEKEREDLIEREKSLLSRYESRRSELQKEERNERHEERRLFELKNKKLELNTTLELLKIREEHVNEEEALFKSEWEEARHFFGASIDEEIRDTEEERGNDENEQESRRRRIEKLKFKIEDIGSGGNEILEEYKEVKERSQFLKDEIFDLEKSADALHVLITDLEKKIASEFKEGVHKVNKEFDTLFSIMFEGGSASIKIVPPEKEVSRGMPKGEEEGESGEALLDLADTPRDNSEDEKGIDIKIILPRKHVKGLSMLSGGERALTSIALIFALMQVSPPPFLILDETDAALDEVNSRKYGMLLQKLSKQTQFIIITHNRETMAKAGVLYGVTTARNGTSRLLSIKLDDAVELAL